VATGRREITQAYAVRQFERHPDVAGLRWWSTLEASWIHVMLFDRALDAVNVLGVRLLAVDDEVRDHRRGTPRPERRRTRRPSAAQPASTAPIRPSASSASA